MWRGLTEQGLKSRPPICIISGEMTIESTHKEGRKDRSPSSEGEQEEDVNVMIKEGKAKSSKSTLITSL